MRKIVVFIICIFFFSFPSFVHAEDILTTEKLITVDIGKQMAYAWEGGKIVYQSPVATGLPKSPTVKGTFKIYLKYGVQKNMRGVSPYIGAYNYKNVPHVMYFHQSYALHGAYWHNTFGTPRSNGCVNLPLYAAEWFFNWAPLGTKVVVF